MSRYVRELELRYRPGRLMRFGSEEPLTEPKQVFEAFREMATLPKEVGVVVHLDGGKRVLGCDIATMGDSCSAPFLPKDIVRPVLYTGAAAALVLHNPPSGNPRPSPEDVLVTRRLKEVFLLIGVEFCDHVIVGQDGFFSFAEEGLLS